MRPAWVDHQPLTKYLTIFLIIAVLSAALYGMGFAIPLAGPWVDFTVSRIISHETGLRTRCEKVKIFHWSKASFESTESKTRKQSPLLTTGSGSIYFGKPPFTIIDLKDLRLAAAFQSTGFFSSWPIAQGLEGKLLASHLRVSVLSRRSGRLIHILKCESDDFLMRGGLILTANHVTKAHLYFSLSPARLEKLPLFLRSRMIKEKEGWTDIQLVLSRNQLTLFGRRGLLFQAKWEREGSGFLG